MKAHILLVALATICTLVHAQCGGTFSGYSGSIVSDPYTSDMYCIYVIAPPSSYYTHVQITFTSVSTEQGYDYVSVYDGQITSTSSELISKFSGWSVPPPFKSSQPYVTIIFQTDAYVNMDGWALTYQYYSGTPPSCAGPRWLTDISNAVLSGTIHGNSSAYVTCDYIIEMPVYYYDDWYGSCKEYIQVALNSWDDSTQSAVADVYSGQNEWGIWYGSFQMGSESGDSINVQSEYGQAFVRYSVSTNQGSLSSYSMSVSMVSECDSPSDEVHTKVGSFLAWFLPLILSLICITCVIVAIAYRSSKKRELHQTSKYQNMAVPLQTVPHTQDSQPVQNGPHPGSYVTVQQPYPNTTFPPNQMYMTPFNPAMYSSPVPMAQPAPGLFPPNVMLHTFQPLQPFPQQPSIQQGTQLPVVALEEHQ